MASKLFSGSALLSTNLIKMDEHKDTHVTTLYISYISAAVMSAA